MNDLLWGIAIYTVGGLLIMVGVEVLPVPRESGYVAFAALLGGLWLWGHR